MKKINTMPYILVLASIILLAPCITVAQNDSSWGCTAADPDSWVCLKDGRSQPEPITAVPAVRSEVSSARQTVSVFPSWSAEEPGAGVRELPVEFSLPVEKISEPVSPAIPACIGVALPDNLTGIGRRQLRHSSPIRLEADEIISESAQKSTLNGNVIIMRADQSIRSDRTSINQATHQVDVVGGVIYDDAQIQVRTEQAHLDFDTDENIFTEASFITKGRYARGAARKIQTSADGDHVRFEGVAYTTCPPDENIWKLKAGQIMLDEVAGRGEAEDVRVEFFDVPVLYLPYLSFPVDDRRVSGVLTPRFGRSGDSGTDITVPVYWNIAPNYDATLYPRYMSKRGLQLGGEFRYLNDLGNGQVNLEYLGKDEQYTTAGDSDRWALHAAHNVSLLNSWNLGADIRRISDARYLQELGSSLVSSNQRHLESRLYLSHSADNWRASGLLQDYQTVDRSIAVTDYPYERMPNLNFDAWTDTFGGGFVASIEAEYTHFDRENSVTGKRADLYSSIAYSYDKPGYYVRPKLGLRYTRYSLSSHAVASSQSRTLPVLTLDGGLFYEREVDMLGKNMLQTLVPRFYYLYVPARNQTNIPIFDTGLYDYNLSSLFSENRFSGPDRIGDTSQLSIGITSRFLDNYNGQEKLVFTAGQTYYFSDRDVTLPGGTRDTSASSPVIGEVHYRPYDRLAASALLHWNPETGQAERTIYRLKYQPADNRILNLAYRYRKYFLQQTDVSLLWPFGRSGHWHAIGRWNHSLRHKKSLDTFAGIEYQGCCWKTRIVARRWVNDVNSDYDTGIFFELEFKGLGNIGNNNVMDLLGTGIPGYDRYIRDKGNDTYY